MEVLNLAQLLLNKIEQFLPLVLFQLVPPSFLQTLHHLGVGQKAVLPQKHCSLLVVQHLRSFRIQIVAFPHTAFCLLAMKPFFLGLDLISTKAD
jgi:hypothetical protein